MSDCPSEEVLRSFLDGSLSPGARERLGAHVAGCSNCARLVALALDEDGSPTLPASSALPTSLRAALEAQLEKRRARPGSSPGAPPAPPASAPPPGRRQRARPLWAGAALLLALGLAAAIWHVEEMRRRDPDRLCPSQAPRVAAVWSPERRVALESAFASLMLHDGLDQVRSVERGFDAYAEGWAKTVNELCRAQVRHQETDAIYLRRAACLDQRLEELGSLIALLTGSADRATLLRAPGAVASLAPLSSCDDSRSLRESDVPPVAPELPAPENSSPESKSLRNQASPEAALRTSKLAEARASYAEARALASVGAFERSMALLGPVVQTAHEMKYGALESEALLLMGRDADHSGHYRESERMLRDAAITAELARRDDVAAKAFCQLIYVAGNDLDQVDDALRWADFAQQAIDRAGGGPDLQGWREQHLGSVLANHKRAAEALPHFKAALELAEKNDGPDAPELGTPTEAYAVGLVLAHRYEDALPPMRRALELMLRKWPKSHPNVAEVYSNLADTLFLAGHLEEAEAPAREALASALETLGPDNETTAIAETELAQILREQRRATESIGYARQALEICVQKKKCTAAKTGDVWQSLGAALFASGERIESRAALEQALALRTQTQSDDLPETQLWLAQLLWDDPDQRVRSHELALEAKAGTQPDDPRLAKIDVWLSAHTL